MRQAYILEPLFDMVELVHWYSIDHRHFAMIVLENKDHVEILEMKLDAFKVDKFNFIECNHQRRLQAHITSNNYA